jgi:hypothetical protein
VRGDARSPREVTRRLHRSATRRHCTKPSRDRPATARRRSLASRHVTAITTFSPIASRPPRRPFRLLRDLRSKSRLRQLFSLNRREKPQHRRTLQSLERRRSRAIPLLAPRQQRPERGSLRGPRSDGRDRVAELQPQVAEVKRRLA